MILLTKIIFFNAPNDMAALMVRVLAILRTRKKKYKNMMACQEEEKVFDIEGNLEVDRSLALTSTNTHVSPPYYKKHFLFNRHR